MANIPYGSSQAEGAISIDSQIDLLDKSIETIWMQRNEFTGVLAQFFMKMQGQGGVDMKMSNVGSTLPLPIKNEDNEALPYFNPPAGFDKTYTYVNYRSGIRVLRSALESDRFSKVMSMVTGQAKSAFRLDEYLRAGIFDNAFTGTSGADSLSLCNGSHPNEASETGTWDNSSTGALSGPNLQALRLKGANMTDAQGDPDPLMVQKLLVQPALEQKAKELVNSTKDAETALNTETQLITTLDVVVSPYLSSTTQYFLIGDRQGEGKGLFEIVLSDWNVGDNSPANRDIVVDKRVRGRKVIDFHTSRNVIGSTGA